MKREKREMIKAVYQFMTTQKKIRFCLALLMISLLLVNGISSAVWAAGPTVRSGALTQSTEKTGRLKMRALHLQRLQEQGGPLEMLLKNSLVPVRLSLDEKKGLPNFVSGMFPGHVGVPKEKAAIEFLTQARDVYMMAQPDEELRVIKTQDDDLGMTHVKMQQQHRGLRVFGAEMTVHLDADSNVRVISGNFVPQIDINPTPYITSQQTAEIAGAEMGGQNIQIETPELLIFNKLLFTGSEDRDHLAWRHVLSAENGFDEWVYFIDAQSGEILFKYSNIRDAKSRETYTADNTKNLPGRLLIREGGTSTDAAAQAAQTNVGIVYDYYQRTFKRDSFDGRGSKIISSVHYDRNLVNAFWNGKQLAFGDGDGKTTRPLSQVLDVVAHELTHAVDTSSANLVYAGQSGALSESFADIFGAMVDRDDWLCGEDAFLSGSTRKAFRSMADPTLFNQPDHMSNFVNTEEDNGGVHINSGIQNKACYLIADGGTHRGIAVKGVGREATEKIFYRALTDYLTSSSQFKDARNAAVQAATDLFGEGSAEQKATQDAFSAVGIGTGGDDSKTGEWTEVIQVSGDTPHPYPNNYSTYHYYAKPGAQKVAMHFSAFDLEEDYDFMLVYNQFGQLIDAHTGTKEPFWLIVDGGFVMVVLITDEAVTGYGYHIDKVAYLK